MGNYFLLFLMLSLCVVLPRNISSQSNSIYSLQLKLNDSLYTPFGQVQAKIIYYTADTTFFLLLPGSNMFQIKINGGNWTDIPSLKFAESHGDGISRLENERVDHKYIDLFELYLTNPTIYYPFLENGGLVQCRYSVEVPNGGNTNRVRVFSNTINLNLPAITSFNKDAFNYLILKKEEFPEILYFTSVDVDNTTMWTIPIYYYIIANYPNSLFAEFAKVRVAMYKCSVGHGMDEFPSGLKNQLQQEYNELSVSVYSQVREIAKDLEICLTN